MKRAIVFAAILIFAHVCLATTIHVPADQPSIQAGINAAVTGDTVLVAPGTYSQSFDFKGKGIVVTSSDGPEMTFLNPSGTPVVSFVSGEPLSAELSGFTLRNTQGDQHIRIMYSSQPLIKGNVFANLTASGSIIYSDASGPRIERNLFHHNDVGSACVGLIIGTASIVNNTFDHNSRGFFSNGYGQTVAKNNIVTNSGGCGISGRFSDLSYNDVWNNQPDYQGGTVAGTGSISVDPYFTDPEHNDYRLLANSPCLDVGDPNPAYNDPDGTRNDMGAILGSRSFPVCLKINYGALSAGHVVRTLFPEIYWNYYDTSTIQQVAFELQVGTDKDWTVSELWSSGVVTSADTEVTYSGSPLVEYSTCYLRLRLYNGSSWGEWAQDYFRVKLTRTIPVPSYEPTIQSGINAAEDGDTVLVAPGSYSEQIDYKGKGIVVTSSNGPEVTFLNPSSTPMVSFVKGEPSSAELRGFTFRNTSGDFHVSVAKGARPLIQGNIFANLTASQVLIKSQGNGHPRIVRNLFYNNSTGDACIGVHWDGAADIINNTFDGNSGGLNTFGLTVAKNNIITNSTGYGIYVGDGGSGTWCYSSYNDVWNNGSNYTGFATPGTGSLSTDPQFVDQASHNFRLQLTSPCVDAGDPDSTYNDLDGTRGDMGALRAIRPYPLVIGINYGTQASGHVVSTYTPEIYWTYIDTANFVQKGYEMEIGLDTEWTVAEVWSSGYIVSSDNQATYNGPALSDRTTYYLRMRVYNEIAWSEWANDTFRVVIPKTIRVPADQPSIQAGIDAAVTTDTVLVAPGSYSEQIDYKGKGIVVTSSNGPEVTFLNPSGTPVVSFIKGEPSCAELRGFTLRSTSGYQHVRITSAAEPLIQGNIFTNLNAYEVLILCEGAHPRIVRNLFYNNSTGNACIGVSSGAADIINNTFDRNGRGFYSYGQTVAKNNIITNSVEYGIHGSYSNLSYNDVWNNNPNYQGGASAGAGSFSVDPFFVDAAGHDYHLLPGSPCVNAGSPDPKYNDPDGSRNDMGAIPGSFIFPVCTKINYGDSSIGHAVATLTPEIRWNYYDTSTSQQVAFELQVGTDRDWTVAELWNSGVVTTAATEIEYSGSPLVDDSTFYLRLRAYNGSRWGEWTEDYFHIHIVKIIHVPADKPSIQAGINAAMNGDKVLVAPGSYSEQIDYKGKGIVVTSSNGPEVTFLNPSGTPVVSFIKGEPSSAELSGFTLQSTGGNQHIRITSAAEPLIQGNIFKNLTTNDVLIYSEGMHPRIVRNLFYNNSTGWACIGIASGAADIINNTFDGNRRGFYSFGSTVAKNNIVTNSLEYGITGSYSELSYNDVWNNRPDYDGGAASGIGSISLDPQFVSRGNLDFRLLITSPCINSGNPDPKYNDPDGSRNDMGAIPFRVNHVPSAVALVSPSNTLDTAITTIRPTFSWTASIDPDVDDTVGYCLMIAVDSNFAFVQSIPNLSSTSYTLTSDLLWGHRYWWKVKSADLYGGINWSTHVFYFRTMTLGDASNDEDINVIDIVYLVNYIFSGGKPPLPLLAGDANCDGRINIADCICLIRYIFAGGPAPCSVM
jgi:hypothetical protein